MNDDELAACSKVVVADVTVEDVAGPGAEGQASGELLGHQKHQGLRTRHTRHPQREANFVPKLDP